MKTAIIIHGKPPREEYFDPQSPSPSNHHWLPWLQRQLLLNSVLAQTPEMPEPFAPDYAEWSLVFEQFRIDTETALIGHSCGAGFLLRWLSEHPIRVGKVALVAPWIDPYGDRAPQMFNGLQIDWNVATRTQAMRSFISSDDGEDKLATVSHLEKMVKGIETQWFDDRGHFIYANMRTTQFPELLDFLLA